MERVKLCRIARCQVHLTFISSAFHEPISGRSTNNLHIAVDGSGPSVHSTASLSAPFNLPLLIQPKFSDSAIPPRRFPVLYSKSLVSLRPTYEHRMFRLAAF